MRNEDDEEEVVDLPPLQSQQRLCHDAITIAAFTSTLPCFYPSVNAHDDINYRHSLSCCCLQQHHPLLVYMQQRRQRRRRHTIDTYQHEKNKQIQTSLLLPRSTPHSTGTRLRQLSRICGLLLSGSVSNSERCRYCLEGGERVQFLFLDEQTIPNPTSLFATHNNNLCV